MKQTLPILQLRKWQNSGRFGDLCNEGQTASMKCKKVGEQVSLDSSQTQPHPCLAFGKVLMEVPTSLLPYYPSSLREGTPLPLRGPFPTHVPAWTVPQMPCNPNFTVLRSQESSKTSLNTSRPHSSTVSFSISAELCAQPFVTLKKAYKHRAN